MKYIKNVNINCPVSGEEGTVLCFIKYQAPRSAGIDAHVIDVESDVSNGLPSFDLVGLLTTEVREARGTCQGSNPHNTGIIMKPKE